MIDTDAARARGRRRAEDFIYGVRLAANGWPRTMANTDDARRGFDRMTRRLRGEV